MFKRVRSVRNEDRIALYVKKIQLNIALLLFLFIKVIYGLAKNKKKKKTTTS